jgi:hypothetical protein
MSRILLRAKNGETSEKDLVYEKLNPSDIHCFIEGEKVIEKEVFYKLTFYKKNKQKLFAVFNKKLELVENISFWSYVAPKN